MIKSRLDGLKNGVPEIVVFKKDKPAKYSEEGYLNGDELKQILTKVFENVNSSPKFIKMRQAETDGGYPEYMVALPVTAEYEAFHGLSK